MPTEEEINEAIADLEEAGILIRTGEYQPNRIGVLEPVYVHA